MATRQVHVMGRPGANRAVLRRVSGFGFRVQSLGNTAESAALLKEMTASTAAAGTSNAEVQVMANAAREKAEVVAALKTGSRRTCSMLACHAPMAICALETQVLLRRQG